MPQIAIIPTYTTLNITGNNIDIVTRYFEPDTLPDTILSEISEESGENAFFGFVEGILMITMKNHPDNINYFIDDNGHLILVCTTGDSNNYSIDENSHLIYTT